jgi:tetratricopeptide (TPR) repeat protein
MGRKRSICSSLLALILLATALVALEQPGNLHLKVVDLHAAPVQGLVFRGANGQVAQSPTDGDGLTSIQLDDDALSSGWMRISPTSSSLSDLEAVFLEPWNGFVPLDKRRGRMSEPVRVVVARFPVETESIDTRIATSVAAWILAQESLHGGSTRAGKGERLALIADRASALGLTSESLTESLNSLSATTDSQFAAGIGSLWKGDLKAASDRLLELWKQAEESPAPDPVLGVDSAHFLGITFLQLGEFSRAAFLLSKACDIRPGDLDLLTLLGKALYGEGSFTEAESALQRVLEERERQAGTDDPSLSPILNNLAILYLEQGRYAEARNLNQRALAIEEAASSPSHPSVVALLTNLAAIHTALGEPLAAEPLLRRALEIEEQAHGESSEESASTLNNLALVYFETGRLIEARQLYTRVLAIDSAFRGPNSAQVASDLSNLALISDQLDSVFEAEKLYRQALDLREELLEANHPDLAKSYANLAWFYHRQHHFEEAETLYLDALEVLEAGKGADPVHLAWTLKCLGMLYQKLERYDESAPLYRRSLEIFESLEDGSHPDMTSLLWNYAALLEETGRTEEAEELEERARSLRQSE